MDVKTQTDGADASLTRDPAGQPDRNGENSGDTGPKPDSFLRQIGFVLKLVVAVLIIRTFVFAPFSIPSESMLPRLWNGDYLIASKWSYGYSDYSLPFKASVIPGRILANQPERGDVVIFKHPIDQQDYIKRVIGLPGDEIGMRGGRIMLNGTLIEAEPMAPFVIDVTANTPCGPGAQDEQISDEGHTCSYRRFRETLPGGATYEVLDLGLTPGDTMVPVTVPTGHIFVMGDNRDNSRDSRFPAMAGDAVGLVPQANLVGRAQVIIWSTDGSAQWINPWTWFSAARWQRIGTGL